MPQEVITLREKRVLVTGANGFIGSHLCQALSAQGAQTFGFVRKPRALELTLTEQHQVDVQDRLLVKKMVQDLHPEFVVHLAAVKNRSLDLAEYRAGYEGNLFGAINLIEACQELTISPRFIFLGSCEEYGHNPVPFDETSRESPVSAYAASKLAVTQLLQTLARAIDFQAVILRPSIVYGPGQDTDMFLPALIKSLVSGESFPMTPGEQTRDYVYIDDVVDAILRVLTTSGLRGRVINISSGIPVCNEDLAKNTAQLIGIEAVKLIGFGARNYRPGEAMNYWADNSLALELLGWMPCISLEDGLRRTISYFRGMKANG